MQWGKTEARTQAGITACLPQGEHVCDRAFLDSWCGGGDVELGFEGGFPGGFPEGGVLDGGAAGSGDGAGDGAVLVDHDADGP